MVIEPILGLIVGAAFAWLFVYSAAFVGAKHALREQHTDARVDGLDTGADSG